MPSIVFNRTLFVKIFLGVLFFSFSAHAQELLQGLYAIEASPSTLTLRVKQVPVGRFDTQALNALEGEVYIDGKNNLAASLIRFDAAKISSVVSLRDEHIKNKHFEVATYPRIDLSKIKSLGPVQKNARVAFTGILKLKKETSPMQGTFKITTDKNLKELLHLEAEFRVKMSDVKISPPSYFGVSVEDEVEIFIEANFKKSSKNIPANFENEEKFFESLVQ